jgi:O-antigen/teichoic acid export membrane protein
LQTPDGPEIQRRRTRDLRIALKNGLNLAGSLVITWSVALIVRLQVPAHLGPIRQGHFGFAESFAGMFFTVVGLGIDTYIIKEVSVRPRHASDVVGGVFVFRAALSVLLLAAIAVSLRASGRAGEILPAALVFGLANLVMSVNSTLSAVLQATGHSGRVAVASVAGKVVWGVGMLLGLYYHTALVLLALPVLVGELLKALMLGPFAHYKADLRYRVDAGQVRIAIGASVPYFVSALALGVLGGLGMSVLEFLSHDEREVGWFAADQNLGGLCLLLTPLLTWVAMPLLSRAYQRSEKETLFLLSRTLEALIVVIAPMTVLISAGADILIHIAFGDKYAPAGVGLSILSLVFVVTYVNTMLSIGLITMGRGWSVTLVSIGSVFVSATLMLAIVPLGRRLLIPGGECAGAAASVILTELCVTAALVSRFSTSPLDRRTLRAFAKSLLAGAAVLVTDRQLHSVGAIRLAADAVLYAAIALVLQLVSVQDLRRAWSVVRTRGGGEAAGGSP